jgi:4-alpha-glucanotransferase
VSTLRGWWREDGKVTSNFYNNVLCYNDAAPAEASGNICEQVVRQHLDSPSLLCILALQDWFSIDETLRLADADAERINVPANPRHYWRYRMHLTLEELMGKEEFNKKITQMVCLSHRL